MQYITLSNTGSLDKSIHEFSLAEPITAPFINMQTSKFKGRPTNALPATANQMFDGFFQILTNAERVVIKSLSTAQTTKHSSAGNCKLGGAAKL